MKLVDEQKIIETIDHAWQIEKMVRAHDAQAADRIKGEIEGFSEHKLCIAVVGVLKRGKSTFCNAFLERRDDAIAPTDSFPTTSIITKFYKSAKEYASVHFGNQSSQEIPYDEIRSFVTEEGNPENRKDVSYVEVFGNFDLDENVTLVDLPGDDSIHVCHSDVVYRYLPSADVIIFLSSADDPINRSELNLLRNVQSSELKKIFFVINKADKCDSRQLEDAISHDRDVITKAGITIENDMYVISAKQAMHGDVSCYDFQRLLNDIRSFIDDDRIVLHLQSFAGRVMAIAAPIFRDIKRQQEFSEADAADLEEKIKELQEKKSVMRDELDSALKEFDDSWDAMLDDFENALPDIKKNVESKLVGDIETKPALAISNKIIKGLPDKISQTIEQGFNDSCGILKGRAEQALEKLNKSCPNISNFLSNQDLQVDVKLQKDGYGGWVFTLVSGSASYISGSLIAGGFAIGSGWGVGGGLFAPVLATVGKVVGVVTGAVTTVFLGPLFLISTIGVVTTLSAMTISVLRKKSLKKELLINEIRKALKTAFDSIRFERLKHLRDEKERLVKTVRKEFEDNLAKYEQELNEALKRKHDAETNRLIAEQKNIQLVDYSEVTCKMLENVRLLEESK